MWLRASLLSEPRRWSSPGWLVDVEGGGARRGLDVEGAGSPVVRRRGALGTLRRLVDEGVGGSPAVLETTQRGSGWSRARVRRGAVEALVFYNLSLSKVRNRGKPDIAERLAEEAPPLSGHGQ